MSDGISTRRSFFLKAGAAVSVPGAFAAGIRPAAAGAGALEAKVAELEDEIALRRLCAETVAGMNGASHHALDDLEQGLRRIVPDHEADAAAGIVVSRDRTTARIRVPCTVRLEDPIEAPGSSLLDMARLQGEGVVTRTQARVLEIVCTRTTTGWEPIRAQLRPA